VVRRPRVVVALPDRTEGPLVANWLSENQCEPVDRSTLEAAATELRMGAFDLVIVDANWASGNALQKVIRVPNRPTPTILIGDATDRRAGVMDAQAMYLTRPIDLAMLSCFVVMALMDDRPVRRSPRKPVQQFDALVNGEPAGILDVSPEGLRLALRRDRRVPPPYFAVRIPLLGVAVIASRRWTMSSSTDASTIWCGAALSNNRPSSEEAWRSFVDTVPIVGQAGVRVTL
jgi:hypothetical protein